MVRFELNGKQVSVDVENATPLLWVLRDNLQQIGTKYGCGIGQCGACIVHINGNSAFSCLTPIESVAGLNVKTIEGLASNHIVQKSWIKYDVPQCGYCQAGQIMNAVAFLEANPDPSDREIDKAMRGNICRCGTYDRIRLAIKDAAKQLKNNKNESE